MFLKIQVKGKKNYKQSIFFFKGRFYEKFK